MTRQLGEKILASQLAAAQRQRLLVHNSFMFSSVNQQPQTGGETQKQESKGDQNEDFDAEYERYQEEQRKNEFKWHRRVIFAIGKSLKYMMWASFVYFSYHVYLAFNHKEPEKALLASNMFLEWAYKTRYAYTEVKELMTMPPSRALLGERPDMGPGF